MKSIKISYVDVNDINWDNSVVEVCLDYPKYVDKRLCYMHELSYFDSIMDKIKEEHEENIRYSIYNYRDVPNFIKINDDVFKELQDYLKEKTEYEECKINDDFSLLSAIMSIYRNDPKCWE